MRELYVLPVLTKVNVKGKTAFIIGNNNEEVSSSLEEISYYIKFATDEVYLPKEAKENPKDNYDEIIKMSDIEGVWILPYYTKVEVDGKVGFIMWSDEETSEEDLSDLNYLIKFGDDLDKILEDIKFPDYPWYDNGFLHYKVRAI